MNWDTNSFIKKCNKIHNYKYNYINCVYDGFNNKVDIICKKHGAFSQKSGSHLNGMGCTKCKYEIISDKLSRKLNDKEIKWLKINYNDISTRKYSKYLKIDTKTLKKQLLKHGFVDPSIKRHKNLFEEISIGFWNRLLTGARVKKHKLQIDPKFIWNLYLKQNKKCALSGLEIIFDKKLSKTTVSIDRINSEIGYLKNNVQLVHKVINIMKLDFNEKEFCYMCRKISEYNKYKF